MSVDVATIAELSCRVAYLPVASLLLQLSARAATRCPSQSSTPCSLPLAPLHARACVCHGRRADLAIAAIPWPSSFLVSLHVSHRLLRRLPVLVRSSAGPLGCCQRAAAAAPPPPGVCAWPRPYGPPWAELSIPTRAREAPGASPPFPRRRRPFSGRHRPIPQRPLFQVRVRDPCKNLTKGRGLTATCRLR